MIIGDIYWNISNLLQKCICNEGIIDWRQINCNVSNHMDKYFTCLLQMTNESWETL